MRTLTQHIAESKALHQNVNITEKLIVNKNYLSDNAIDYLDSNIDELYLIRFRPEEGSIYIDIITKPYLELVVDKPDKKIYELTGNFYLCDAHYTRAQFKPDSHDFLFRWNTAFQDKYDLLLHPFYAHEFKKFVESFDQKYGVTYFIDEIFAMFNLDYDSIPDRLKNIEYSLSDIMNDTRLNILKKYLRNK